MKSICRVDPRGHENSALVSRNNRASLCTCRSSTVSPSNRANAAGILASAGHASVSWMFWNSSRRAHRTRKSSRTMRFSKRLTSRPPSSAPRGRRFTQCSPPRNRPQLPEPVLHIRAHLERAPTVRQQASPGQARHGRRPGFAFISKSQALSGRHKSSVSI